MEEILGTIYAEVSEDFQRGIYPIVRKIKAEQHDLAVVTAVRSEGMETKILGNVLGENYGSNFAGNVYDKNKLSPTIRTFQGGNQQPMIVAMRGRNPDRPSDRTAGSPTEQRLEPNSQGICNTLTSVQKDNMVLENIVIGGEQKHQAIKKDGICTCLTSSMGCGGGYVPMTFSQYRIRKLTPIECWRLMGFSDEDFRKAEEGNSNTQLYKQAGNSIVKNVLMAIFGQMIPGKENVYKEL